MPDQLKKERLKAAVAEHCATEMDVSVLASIDSSNSWSLQQCKAGRKLPFACFAEQQTQGRGRRGKHWLTPPHANIALSLSWPFALSHQSLYLLPLSVSVAIVKSLESFGLGQVQIKWPNDIYVSEKKIAGVLIETRPAMADSGIGRLGQIAVVIGVGLNYDMASLDEGQLLEKPVYTDICEQIKLQLIDRVPERTDVAASLLHHIINVCQNFQWQAEQCLQEFRLHYDYCRHKNVDVILDNKEVLTGVASGVTDKAELVVIIKGEDYVFNSAEVSVRATPGTAVSEVS